MKKLNNKKDSGVNKIYYIFIITGFILLLGITFFYSISEINSKKEIDIFGVKINEREYNKIVDSKKMNETYSICNIQDNKCVILRKIK